MRWVFKRMHPVVVNLSGLALDLADHEEALRKRQAEVTSYLQTAHELIQHAHDEIAQGRVPHGTCQQILDTGELLVRAIGDAVSAEDAERLRNLLKGAYEVEGLNDALQDESQRQMTSHSWTGRVALLPPLLRQSASLR